MKKEFKETEKEIFALIVKMLGEGAPVTQENNKQYFYLNIKNDFFDVNLEAYQPENLTNLMQSGGVIDVSCTVFNNEGVRVLYFSSLSQGFMTEVARLIVNNKQKEDLLLSQTAFKQLENYLKQIN